MVFLGGLLELTNFFKESMNSEQLVNHFPTLATVFHIHLS